MISPVPALAVDAAVEPAEGGKRFMSLQSVRDGTARAQKKIEKPGGLHSDTGAMKNGFMLLDRGRAVPIPLQHSLLTPTASPAASAKAAAKSTEPSVVRGINPSGLAPHLRDNEEIANADSANPILSLFNGDGAGPLASFRDALGGKASSPASSLPLGRHAWPIPVAAAQKFSSAYGPRRDPFDGTPEFHGGIDIAAPTGTPVLATADGTITKTGHDKNYGIFVAIANADGSESHYGHLSAKTVRDGQRVQRGQTIGAVGSTGRSTGAHLDYRISQNGQRIDPMRVLSAPASTQMAAANDAPRGMQKPRITARVIEVR
jgi:murein DD-endopeptidase MepM/ murein hydrolase activator NlpD